MRHTVILTMDTDSRYDSPQGQNLLCDLIVGRAWTVDGVLPHGAAGFIKTEAIVHTRAEYDGMRSAIRDKEARILALEARLAARDVTISELMRDVARLSAPAERPVGFITNVVERSQ